ncbi:MAG: hypothetical protein SCARUB_00772 [Candidatus Scalindua rubra]|uniref:Uncharacterized protein n=1 Tax=Candidatus Scalindua rubra TaxID=1872076 RepID=A0A1E3XES4_9BACT|nr:MAG: hypothetical protein SCARUB_00772 [Candidatus Scalindua rubra]
MAWIYPVEYKYCYSTINSIYKITNFTHEINKSKFHRAGSFVRVGNTPVHRPSFRKESSIGLLACPTTFRRAKARLPPCPTDGRRAYRENTDFIFGSNAHNPLDHHEF